MDSSATRMTKWLANQQLADVKEGIVLPSLLSLLVYINPAFTLSLQATQVTYRLNTMFVTIGMNRWSSYVTRLMQSTYVPFIALASCFIQSGVFIDLHNPVTYVLT
jgi:hypothetical protein